MPVKPILSNANRVLYMSHLAIGDYLYQRTFLAQLKQQYPQLELHIWLDDFRKRPKDWTAGRASLMQHWLENESFIDGVFPLADNQSHRRQLLADARAMNFDAVFFIATARSGDYARFARQIGENAWCAGLKPSGILSPLSHWHFLKLDHCARDAFDGQSVLSLYGQRFSELTGISPVNEPAQLAVDSALLKQAKKRLAHWHQTLSTRRAVLVNHLSTTPKRNYHWSKLASVMDAMARHHPDSLFIINTPPHQSDVVRQQVNQYVKRHHSGCVVFSCDSIFELAAMVKSVDAVLTVETAIAHLASLYERPQVTLMRQQSAHWCPPNTSKAIFSPGYINDIPVEEITAACLQHLFADRETSALSG